MAVTRKVKSKEEIQHPPSSGAKEEVSRSRTKRVCIFCKTKTEPHFWDAVALRKFMNNRGRIVARSKTGACSKHQRRISQEIKRARHLALLPYTVGA